MCRTMRALEFSGCLLWGRFTLEGVVVLACQKRTNVCRLWRTTDNKIFVQNAAFRQQRTRLAFLLQVSTHEYEPMILLTSGSIALIK